MGSRSEIETVAIETKIGTEQKGRTIRPFSFGVLTCMAIKDLLNEIGEAVEGLVDGIFDIEDDEPDRLEVYKELGLLTTDKPKDAERRALGIYLSIVRHIKAGGSVKFLSPDGKIRTLKVPLR